MAKVMLITGASSGIGEATARRLAREPEAALVLVARREERLRDLAAALGGTATVGGAPRVSFLATDLLDEDTPARVREHVLERYGRLDLLVNNAGAAWRASFAHGGYENVRRTMAINFDAQLRLTEALLPLLRESAPSAIVNVASTAARVARAGSGAYSASKFALAGWSDALYAEEHARGVHVGLVLPGFISTEGFPRPSSPPSRGHAGSSPRPRRPPRPSTRPASAGAPNATCRAPTGSPRRCGSSRPRSCGGRSPAAPPP